MPFVARAEKRMGYGWYAVVESDDETDRTSVGSFENEKAALLAAESIVDRRERRRT